MTVYRMGADKIRDGRDALGRAGFVGFGPPALADRRFEDLRAEALAQQPGGWGRPDTKTVDHRAWRAHLGPVAKTLMTDPETLELMRDMAGCEVTPSFEASCFTYYEGPQDYLGAHLDRADACAYTLIVYLTAEWPAGETPGDGLALLLFGDPAAPERETGRIETRANAIAVGRGAEILHGRPALGAGEQVIALTACFAAASPAARADASDGVAADRPTRVVEDGFRAWGQGHYELAHERFDRALALDGAGDQAWSGKGFVCWSEGTFEAALDAFTKAVRCNGHGASHWSNIGLCLRELGRLDEAIAAFATSLTLDADYAPALNEWGNVLQDGGQADDALDFYFRALAIDPTRAVVHHNLGVAYTRLDEPHLALQAFWAALERDPDYPHTLTELGLIYAEAGATEAAEELLARAGTDRAAHVLASVLL